MFVQIYEIQTPREAEAMIRLGVDCIGSVLLPGSGLLQPELRDTIRTVQASGRRSSLIPLTGQADAVAACMDYYRPDVLHFCENLAAGEAAAARALELQLGVKARFPEVRIMRSLPIAPHSGAAGAVPTLDFAGLFEAHSDFFLTDTLLVGGAGLSQQDQPVQGFVGITGVTCDWGMAARLVSQSRLPVILAGGLSPENVRAAVERVRPAGVDSCTLTNAVDGNGKPVRFQKDCERVRRFIGEARSAAASGPGP